MKKLSDWLKTWSIPQAIVAGVALVCMTALAITITVQEDWGKLFRWLADPATSGLLISIATLAGVLYHRALGLPPTLLLLLALAVPVSGCGAGALAMQARAATIAGVGLGSVGQQIHDDRDAELDACTDTACEDAGEAKWAPAVAALESVRTALTTWVDALDVARQAGEPDSDILGALLVAVSHLAHEWNDLAAALRAVGVPLPDLPPAVSALLGAVTV